DATNDVGQIGLIAVPAKQSGRIDHRPRLSLRTIEQRQPAVVIEVITPGDEWQDDIVIGNVAGFRPDNRVDLGAGSTQRLSLWIIGPLPRLRIGGVRDQDRYSHISGGGGSVPARRSARPSAPC